MQLPAHTFGQILSEGDILLGKGELERVPGVVVGTFRLHEHGRFCLFCAVSCYQGTGLHTRVLDVSGAIRTLKAPEKLFCGFHPWSLQNAR